VQEKLENVIYIEIQDALFSSLPFPGKFPPLFSISAILLSAYIGLQVSVRFLLKFKIQVRQTFFFLKFRCKDEQSKHLIVLNYFDSYLALENYLICAKFIQHRK
jgi:hypothetical protein